MEKRKCKFCGGPVNKEIALYCSTKCRHYENQANWLNKKRKAEVK